MRSLSLVFAAAVLAAQHHDNLNAVSWMQNAAEYRAAAIQAYRSAKISVERALQDQRWTAALEQNDGYQNYPPAVILDLDETVLDNSIFQARLTASGTAFSDSAWQKWVGEKKSGLVPGAREFLSFAQARGVRLYYVTNRTCNPDNADDPTVAVLQMHAIPYFPGRLLCRTNTGDKSPRRKEVANLARVLLVIGDDLNDFATLALDAPARAEFVSDFSERWGERWFMIPNPSYGSWERSIADKRKALRH